MAIYHINVNGKLITGKGPEDEESWLAMLSTNIYTYKVSKDKWLEDASSVNIVDSPSPGNALVHLSTSSDVNAELDEFSGHLIEKLTFLY